MGNQSEAVRKTEAACSFSLAEAASVSEEGTMFTVPPYWKISLESGWPCNTKKSFSVVWLHDPEQASSLAIGFPTGD